MNKRNFFLREEREREGARKKEHARLKRQEKGLSDNVSARERMCIARKKSIKTRCTGIYLFTFASGVQEKFRRAAKANKSTYKPVAVHTNAFIMPGRRTHDLSKYPKN